MSKIAENKACPSFSFVATDSTLTSLNDLKGKNVVLYFYPRDNTPGCTTEAEMFKKKYRSFKNRNTEIVGISRDSLSSHIKFIDKLKLPFPLIADQDEAICQMFEVMKDKNMYGKKVRGIERSTFLINDKGKIIKSWRKVKVEGHVEDVLQAVNDLL